MQSWRMMRKTLLRTTLFRGIASRVSLYISLQKILKIYPLFFTEFWVKNLWHFSGRSLAVARRNQWISLNSSQISQYLWQSGSCCQRFARENSVITSYYYFYYKYYLLIYILFLIVLNHWYLRVVPVRSYIRKYEDFFLSCREKMEMKSTTPPAAQKVPLSEFTGQVKSLWY